jgi:SAM-dependent methyltransferase
LPPDSYPLRRAALAQLGGLVMVILLVIGMVQFTQVDPADITLGLAMLQGGLAAALGLRQGAPPWWLGIHLAFAPLLLLVNRLDIAPGWFLAGFVLLLLIFWRTDKSRVPLYLSNRATATALLDLLPHEPCRVIDLGCGDGGLLSRLARARPDCHFTGIEHAPLPWLVAWLRTLSLPNVSVQRGDFWREPLAQYDLVYVFLSPAPMPHLWEKATAEMPADAILVSNSFAIPDIDPDGQITVKDRRATHLYLYRPDKARDSAAFPVIPPPPDRE